MKNTMRKILLQDKNDFNRWIADTGLKPAYNKDQPFLVQKPASYPVIVVFYRALMSGGLTGAEFCWEYVYSADFMEAPDAARAPSTPTRRTEQP